MKTSCEEQLRRKPEQWAQYHTQKAPLVSSTLPVATQSPTPPSPLFSVDFRTDVRKVLITDVVGIGQTADFRALILARISSVGYFAMVWCAIEFSSVIIVCVSTVARHYKTLKIIKS